MAGLLNLYQWRFWAASCNSATSEGVLEIQVRRQTFWCCSQSSCSFWRMNVLREKMKSSESCGLSSSSGFVAEVVHACLGSSFSNWDNSPLLDLFSSPNRLHILSSTKRNYRALVCLSDAKIHKGWSEIATTALYTYIRTKLCVLPGLKELKRVLWSSLPSFGQSRTFYYLISNLICWILGLLLMLLMFVEHKRARVWETRRIFQVYMGMCAAAFVLENWPG